MVASTWPEVVKDRTLHYYIGQRVKRPAATNKPPDGMFRVQTYKCNEGPESPGDRERDHYFEVKTSLGTLGIFEMGKNH
ncbi:hypothetical protein EVAR_24725_1 [Eumeta japonica]|uniref:Uncharacterized protein n=1 Tax=Eumeta variegata TaxID=151549 RepID=A0A4C1VEN6_EUMVA|nr:hypothetical protein EVAR_24725_1 [Eumeta japonica]